MRTLLVLADNDPGTPEQVVAVAAVHHISWATARAGPSKHVGGLIGTVNVRVVAVIYTGSHGQRSGPACQYTWSASRAGRSGPYRDHISWAAARPIPSHFHSFTAWPGPADEIFKSLGSARPGPDKRPMTSPARQPTSDLDLDIVRGTTDIYRIGPDR